MAIELPSELQVVMGLLGLNWPQANEDELVKLADQLKKLASQVDQVQMAADKALTALGEVYQGPAADKMAELWAGISKFSGMIVEACEITSKALMAAAVIIEVCKGQAIVQLVSIQAQLAASTATFGLSTPAIIAAGKLVMSRILDQAVQQLGRTIARPIADLAETAVTKVTGSAPERSNGHGFEVDLEALAACAAELRRHADDIDSHGSSFRRVVDGLDVGNPSDMFGKIAIAAVKEIAKAVGFEVLNRILGSFRDTADKMDQVVRAMADQEDEHSQELNKLGSHGSLFNLSGGLALAGGAIGGASRGGGGRDAGLSAFDSLRPKLAGGSGGGAHDGAQGRLDGLGDLHPHQPSATGGSGSHPGGEGGGDRTNAAVHGAIGLPTGAGRAGMRPGSTGSTARTDLESGSRRTGADAGTSSGSGASGARPAAAGPGMGPPMGMGAMPVGGQTGGSGGGKRGGQVRAAAAAAAAGSPTLASTRPGAGQGGQAGQGGHGLQSGPERGGERRTDPDQSAGEAPAAGVPGAMDLAAAPPGALQLGRVAPDSTRSARENEEEPQPQVYHHEEPEEEPQDDEPFDLSMFLPDAE